MPLRFTDQRPPIPPVDLIQRITPPFPPEQAGGARQAFDEAPVRQLIGLERALAIVGREFSEFERMLDFGCGPGRYIRHLEPLSETTEIHGADIDGQMIDWLRKNVPYGHYEVVPHEPPTSYPDGTSTSSSTTRSSPTCRSTCRTSGWPSCTASRSRGACCC